MNRIEAIKSQIDTIADHVTGKDGYSFATPREISAALLEASFRVEAELDKRPSGQLPANIGKPDGGAA